MLCSTCFLKTKEPQCKQNWGLAVDLVAAPASQAYVERIFSVCGDFTARKRNKTKNKFGEESFLEN